MSDITYQRASKLAEYIIKNKSTVRATAKNFSISKSTVHKDVSHRLREHDFELYVRAKEVLEQNKAERHIRGGIATKKKYLEIKKSQNIEMG